MAHSKRLRIGFVPEHFSTPIQFAIKHYSLEAELRSFPSGTGHMITSLRAGEIDVGIGLTEAWVAGLGKHNQSEGDGGYRIVGSYVSSPLLWAISTGANRDSITSVADIKGSKIGVSRIGSGSDVMGSVLADSKNWTVGFEKIPCETFIRLRQGTRDGTVDFFMWEYFTSKKYYDDGEIKKIGEIYTPWPSWQIVASTQAINNNREELQDLFTKLDLGVKHFKDNPEEAVEYINSALPYSKEDAREWMKTVTFAESTGVVDGAVIEKTVEVLTKAGVLTGGGGIDVQSMIRIP